ncbi:hypothetical protein CHS0354_007392 [Potamilus streckersoni]|uniref:Speedy protein n=1 Tax=Potamilus streckersoni TaxID=2493646 RepID=A0AAE0SRQ7_9BIVA|nr:hypothetical protein CHS0354_007392 [Potamilus streckersoni]
MNYFLLPATQYTYQRQFFTDNFHFHQPSRLPSFEEAFGFLCKFQSPSMTSGLDQLVSAACGPSNDGFCHVIPESLNRRSQGRKAALKRQHDHEKVQVLQVLDEEQSAKKFRSDWDILFSEPCNAGDRNDDDWRFQSCLQQQMPQKKKQSFLVRGKEMRAYFRLLEDEVIQEFLEMDSCMRISDKYLMAMVFAYFKRAGYKIREYSRTNFFVALYLANDMEEDEEELKYEIFPWALGQKWKDRFPKFLLKRDKLWTRIDYRAVVSRRCCEEIMAIEPGNPAWKRYRSEFHAGALRGYMKDPEDDGYPRGPNATPRKCPICDHDSQYDSASPESDSWYISSADESSQQGGEITLTDKTPEQSSFDMKGLEKTLTEDEWPSIEE